MDGHPPASAASLRQRESGVFPPALVEKIDVTVRLGIPNQARNGVDDEAMVISRTAQGGWVAAVVVEGRHG